MANDAYVQVAPDGAGKKVDNSLVNTDRYRQRVVLGYDNGGLVDASAPFPIRDPVAHGTWSYRAGTLSGSGTLSATGRCRRLAFISATVDSSFKINGGDTITLRDGFGLDLFVDGNITDPEITWVSGVIDVFIAVVS